MTIRRSAVVFAVVISLAGCADLTGPVPTDVQLNGYVVERTDAGEPTGKVEFGATAFDDSDSVLEDAALEDVSATVSTAGFTANGAVCGDVVAPSGPVVSVLMLDETASMSTTDPGRDRLVAAKRFVDAMGPDDQASVARFSTSVSPTSDLMAAEVMQGFTSDTDALRNAVDASVLESGNTPLMDAAHDAVTMLAPHSADNRIAIVLTDGEENASSTSMIAANQHARDEGVPLYALGFGGAVPAELDGMVAGTGGYRDLVDTGDGAAVQNLLDNVFSASQAQGCVQLTFSPTPASGDVLQGDLTIDFGRGSAATDYEVRF